MSAITTHVLDTSQGRPAAGIEATLFALEGEGWRELGNDTANEDGRIDTLLPANEPLRPGTYRIAFGVGDYFGGRVVDTFYPWVEIVFQVKRPGEHYHVPLLLSPFGYATYRGS